MPRLTLKRVARPCRRIHRETDGNAMLFVVLVLFTLVCFLVFTVHIGQRFTNKVEMQNAADAAVISGAMWKARGLNAISILNVSMSECLALIIMFKAFDSTLDYTRRALPENQDEAEEEENEAWASCLDAKEDIINQVHQRINEEMKQTWQAPDTLWDIMRALKRVSDAVSRTANVMAYLDASTMADLNGADALFDGPVYQADLGLFMPFATLWPDKKQLPVKDGSLGDDLCQHARDGGEGYANYLCYQNAFDVKVGGREIDSEIEDLWDQLSSCGSDPGIIKDEAGMDHLPLMEYTLQKEQHYNDLCSTGNTVVPLVLADNAEDELRVTSLVQKEEGTDDSTYFSGNDGRPVLSLRWKMDGERITYGEEGTSEKRNGNITLPKYTYAVATAEVYNPGGETDRDLFNQNWQAKLVPVDPEAIQPTFLDGALRLPERFITMESQAAQEILAH